MGIGVTEVLLYNSNLIKFCFKIKLISFFDHKDSSEAKRGKIETGICANCHWDWDFVTGNGNHRQKKNNRIGTGIFKIWENNMMGNGICAKIGLGK